MAPAQDWGEVWLTPQAPCLVILGRPPGGLFTRACSLCGTDRAARPVRHIYRLDDDKELLLECTTSERRAASMSIFVWAMVPASVVAANKAQLNQDDSGVQQFDRAGSRRERPITQTHSEVKQLVSPLLPFALTSVVGRPDRDRLARRRQQPHINRNLLPAVRTRSPIPTVSLEVAMVRTHPSPSPPDTHERHLSLRRSQPPHCPEEG